MNPILVKFFNIEIRYYSLFILIGVIFSYFMIRKEAKRFSMNEDDIFNIFFWTLLFGIIGARIYYVIFNWEYFSINLNEIYQIWKGGLAIHGGLITGFITSFIFSKKYKINFLRLLDIICVPLIFAQAIGRWGNFFNSEAYGSATTLTKLEALHIPKFIIDGMYINEIYYTPTFYFESIWCLIGFLILLIYRRMKFTKVGQITAAYMIWYSIGRFFIESLRTDSLILCGFKAAQIVSAILIIIGLSIILYDMKKSKYEDLYNDINNV